MNAVKDKVKLYIGSYCSIAENVTFLLNSEHKYKNISTFPFKAFVFNQFTDPCSKGDIFIEDDVWIGYNSTILSGVRVKRGAIIGAHSLVVSDVPAYAIVGGVPAKVIKYRFSDKIIKQLREVSIHRPTILISPTFNTNKLDKKFCNICIEFCKGVNCRFSLQIHKIIWGVKKGV